MEEIEKDIVEKIGGKWALDRSDNFDEALKEMGLNVVFRKLAIHAKPSMEIVVENNKVEIVAKTAFFSKPLTCPLNEQYEQEFDGIKMKCMTTWDNNKLLTVATPEDPSKHKGQKFTRERVNDELVQTMWIGDVVCTRVFKKQ